MPTGPKSKRKERPADGSADRETMTGDVDDKAYRDRLVLALTKALAEASWEVSEGVPVVRDRDAVMALLELIAMLTATSERTSTPQLTKEFCDDMGSRLQTMIVNAQADFKKRGSPFTLVHEKDVQTSH